jgi:phosphoribosylaminoimidazole carboxylase (NCAIR synthetase)
MYGKEPAPGRKLGHVTVRADSREALDAQVAHVQAIVDGAAIPEALTRRSRRSRHRTGPR